MSLCARVTTYPPLGKVTTLDSAQVELQVTAVIEWEWNRDLPFEVSLLYSDADSAGHPTTWSAKSVPSSPQLPSFVRKPEDGCRRACFTATFPLKELTDCADHDPAHLFFTVRYRPNPLYPWRFIHNDSGIQTGEIVAPRDRPGPTSIQDILQVDEGWSIQTLAAIEGAAKSYQIVSTNNLAKSTSDDLTLVKKTLGRVPSQLRFMAMIRIEPYWFGCTQDRDFFYLNNEAVLCCFLTKSGQCLSILAVNPADDFYSVFLSNPDGSIVVGGRNDGSSEAPLSAFVAVCADEQKSIKSVMLQARKAISQKLESPYLSQSLLLQKQLSAPPDFTGSFGYCTWNGLGYDLTDEKIVSALDTLAENRIHPKSSLLTTAGNRWERQSSTFPGSPTEAFLGLKLTTKDSHMGWHQLFNPSETAILISSIAHESELSRTYKTRTTVAKVVGNVATDLVVIDPTDVHRFYDDFYVFLKSCGIDFVKTDVQHMLSMLVNPKDRSEIPSAYQSAWNAAHLRHFGGKAISCMSMVPQISFNSFLRFDDPPVLMRNSDDFFPEIPGSHTFHIFINAHNALLTQHLNCVPDWDMFQTSHDYSSYHGAARCISGGPVLITDVPGEHSKELIDAMTAITPSRRRISLRPEVATTVDIWDGFASGQILKIRAATASSAVIVGTFNIADSQREGFLTTSDFFKGNPPVRGHVLRSYSTGQIFLPNSAVTSLIGLKLETRGWDIVTAFPLATTLSSSEIRFACLGFVDKLSGPAAVTNCSCNANGSIEVRVRALGMLGFFFNKPVTMGLIECNERYMIDGTHVTVNSSVEQSTIVTLDLEGSWNEKNLWTQDRDDEDVVIRLVLQ